MISVQQAVFSALKHCLNIHKNESVLILADSTKMELAQSFFENAQKISEHCSLLIIPPLPCGDEPSKTVVSLMAHADVILLLTEHSLSHSNARRFASRKGTRIASLPGITAECLIRNMNGNLQAIADQSRKIADIFTIGHLGQLTTPAGTDLSFSIVRMKGYADTGFAHQAGQFSNIPAGEGCAAPVPGSTQGMLVVDGSIPLIGKMKEPVRMTVRDGYVTRIFGGEEAEKARKLIHPFGKYGKNIAEIGIGTNPNAKITGMTLEDEKVLGTVHVALGNNLSFDGKVAAHCHMDGIVLNPTLVIDGKKIVENGVLQV